MIILTGATGFIGRNVIPALLADGHKLAGVTRDAADAAKMFGTEVEWIECDLAVDSEPVLARATEASALVHLAWDGLPNYLDSFHLTRNLPSDIRFLNEFTVRNPNVHVLATGTCLEYGMQNGPLEEQGLTQPHTPYGLAKDTLRKALEVLADERGFVFQWLRLFYTYGDGQNPRSLLAQLDAAIDRGDKTFKMSNGEQLRDYVPAAEIGRIIAQLLRSPECTGVVNCSSGEPTSVRRLVEERLRSRGSEIELLLGEYPYPTYEPLAFWGVPTKLRQIGGN